MTNIRSLLFVELYGIQYIYLDRRIKIVEQERSVREETQKSEDRRNRKITKFLSIFYS